MLSNFCEPFSECTGAKSVHVSTRGSYRKRLRHLLPFLSCILWRQNSNTIRARKMYSLSQELLRDYHENEEEEEEEASNSRATDPLSYFEPSKAAPSACSASPTSSPTVHVSYALSQLSQAISSDPPFLRYILAFHPHFLVSPLVHALSSFDDDPIARHLISALCESAAASLSADFVARVSDRLFSGALAWSRRQLYTLDEFGEIELDSSTVSILQYASEVGDGTDFLFAFCPKLLDLSLEALMKTQSDDVRLNCVGQFSIL
ncbi:unnamed protein product [Prunus armeniaca]|uniref:Uncharacterized protein n=1 Tax=Prunus armeniaca TaxID=36596 RepID=A0A6J5TK20_PRUAR|nr:unnamed protein product [Prunus armeniaca]